MQALAFVTPDVLPAEPVSQVATFVGTSAGATSFPEVAGLTTSTPWQYLAAQIGREGSMSMVARNCEPGSGPVDPCPAA
jgi:hypothetical protein